MSIAGHSQLALTVMTAQPGSTAAQELTVHTPEPVLVSQAGDGLGQAHGEEAPAVHTKAPDPVHGSCTRGMPRCASLQVCAVGQDCAYARKQPHCHAFAKIHGILVKHRNSRCRYERH